MADLKPPFTEETAKKKVEAAQTLWNAQSCTRGSGIHANLHLAQSHLVLRRNRGDINFLTVKWNGERNYKLRKELFSFTDDRIAVQLWYEYQDVNDSMQWKRCYGLEDWTFDRETGKMCKRMMSGNDIILGPDGDGEGR